MITQKITYHWTSMFNYHLNIEKITILQYHHIIKIY